MEKAHKMEKAHDVQNVSFSGTVMHLRIDGKDYRFDLAVVSRRLATAAQKQRENFDVAPSGYGIHWPDIDEDLSIDGLLGVKHAPALAAAAR
ncbi:MAG: DUF2442 domain-containing protein [Planctomycetota bacterium]